jgi:hypothetical protein
LLLDGPFEPRKEMSLDGKRIILNMWLILVVLPVVFGLWLALRSLYLR